SDQRKSSLKTRFDDEKLLLARASERLLFGWGRWGRNRVYGEEGQDLAVTDGGWVITLGVFGIVGFIAEFGLLGLTVFRALSACQLTDDKEDRIYLAALSLIVSIGIVDLLPNSGLTPWSWLLSGALLGRVEALNALARRRTFEAELRPT